MSGLEFSSGTSPTSAGRPVACLNCRKRKSKCDREKPSCGQCCKNGLQCNYDERKKSGPKRGYIKQLEQRLAALEDLIHIADQNNSRAPSAEAVEPKTVSPPQRSDNNTNSGNITTGHNTPRTIGLTSGAWSVPRDINFDRLAKKGSNNVSCHEGISDNGYINNRKEDHVTFTQFSEPEEGFSLSSRSTPRPESQFYEEDDVANENNDILLSEFLDEPLPDDSVINELHDVFFSKIHIFCFPFFDRRRYMANYYSKRYSVCYLWYSVWLVSARTVPKFMSLVPIFHERCHRYLFKAEMIGTGEATCCLEYIQALLILAADDFRYRNLPRGWIGLGKAIRCCLQLSVQWLDADDNEEVIEPEDDMAKEECRRTFWHAYIADRLSTAAAGCPMTFVDEFIHVYLPMYDTNLEKKIDCEPITLADIYTEKGAKYFEKAPLFACNIISSYAGGCATRLNLVTAGIPFDSGKVDFSNQRFSDYWRLYMDINHQLDEILGKFRIDPAKFKASATLEALLPWNMVMIILNLTFYERVLRCAPCKGKDEAMNLAKRRCLDVIFQTDHRIGSPDSDALEVVPNIQIFILYLTTKALAVFSQSSDNIALLKDDFVKMMDIKERLSAHIKAMENLSTKLPIVKALLFDINLRLEGNEHREFMLDDAPLRFLVPTRLLPSSRGKGNIGCLVMRHRNGRQIERQHKEQQQQCLHASTAAAVSKSQFVGGGGNNSRLQSDATDSESGQFNILSVLTHGTQSHFKSMKRKWDEHNPQQVIGFNNHQPLPPLASSSQDAIASFQYLSSPLGFGIPPPPPAPPDI